MITTTIRRARSATWPSVMMDQPWTGSPPITEELRHLVSAITINHHWRGGVLADVYTDASQYALGVVLLQEGRIVAIASRKLTPAETRYSATDREHLGLVWAAEKFQLILHQKGKVQVWSDHSAFLNRKYDRMTPRQARWQSTVDAWIPNLSHVKGKSNPADEVSRWRWGLNFVCTYFESSQAIGDDL
jgi:hypothetical protein